LRFRQFGVCHVNTAQSNTLLHGYVLNDENFVQKHLRISEIVIFVLGYFFWLTL